MYLYTRLSQCNNTFDAVLSRCWVGNYQQSRYVECSIRAPYLIAGKNRKTPIALIDRRRRDSMKKKAKIDELIKV